jgi:hypothetical protein
MKNTGVDKMNLYMYWILLIMVFSPVINRNRVGYFTESICDSILAIALIIFFIFNLQNESLRIMLIILTTVYFLFDIYRCLTKEEYLNIGYAFLFLFYAILYKNLFLLK